MKKSASQIGDRVIFIGQAKTSGVVVEVHDPVINGKEVKVHWYVSPEGKEIHRNGRGSYSLDQLKIQKV